MKIIRSIIILFVLIINTSFAQSYEELIESTKLNFPTYQSYKCLGFEKIDIPVFCIHADDSYVNMGTKATEYEIDLLETFLRVFPRKMRERVVEIEFEYKDEEEGAAAAMGIDTDNNFWTIWINTNREASGDKTEIIKSIAHELMHYLTLNITQTTIYTDDCLGMEKILTNCPKKHTLFYNYIKLFWLSINDKKIWPKGDFNGYYDEHPNDFVTFYAVTDPAEDIAETFIEFIFTDKPTDLSLIKNQKINFFWNFEEYINLRTEIRDNLKIK